MCDLQGDDGGDDEEDVIEDGLDGVGGAGLDLHAWEDFVSDAPGDDFGENEPSDECDEGDDELVDENPGITDCEAEVPDVIDGEECLVEKVGVGGVVRGEIGVQADFRAVEPRSRL